MKQVDLNQVATADTQLRAIGLLPSNATEARTVFAPAQALPTGEYKPAIEGWQKAATMPPRGRNSIAYDAIPFTSPSGDTIQVGLGSIFNSIRVVEGMKPEDLAEDAKWAGETAMPTKNYFRYGALSTMESARFLEGNEYRAAYLPQAFTLDTEVVYVVPRFIENSRKPIFDTECQLRKAKCVKDYMAYPDANAQR